jgi:uncharacterized membrane protein YdjX (TVP38/TMEM64 family)
MTQTEAEPQPQPRDWKRLLLRLATGAAALVAGYLLLRYVGGYLTVFRDWVHGLGPWIGPLVFIVGYVVAVAALLPAVVLTLGAGAIFGLAGAVYVFVGATLGSVLAFLISRYFARSAIERRILGDPRFAAIDRAVGEQGFKITFLIRLSPVFPFVFVNYALGLTRVGLSQYALASFGMLPGTFLYVYFGAAGAELAAASGGAKAGEAGEFWSYVLFAVGLAATLAVTVIVTRIATRALREATALPSVTGQ